MCKLYETYVENVRREMKRQGLNQERLAERMGRRQPEVSQMLRRSDALLSSVEEIAEALQIAPVKLFRSIKAKV